MKIYNSTTLSWMLLACSSHLTNATSLQTSKISCLGQSCRDKVTHPQARNEALPDVWDVISTNSKVLHKVHITHPDTTEHNPPHDLRKRAFIVVPKIPDPVIPKTDPYTSDPASNGGGGLDPDSPYPYGRNPAENPDPNPESELDPDRPITGNPETIPYYHDPANNPTPYPSNKNKPSATFSVDMSSASASSTGLPDVNDAAGGVTATTALNSTNTLGVNSTTTYHPSVTMVAPSNTAIVSLVGSAGSVQCAWSLMQMVVAVGVFQGLVWVVG